MQKLVIAIRVLTLVCYFLPFTFFFVTCNAGLDFAYNRREAAKNEAAERVNGSGYDSVADGTGDSTTVTKMGIAGYHDTINNTSPGSSLILKRPSISIPVDTTRYYDTVSFLTGNNGYNNIWADTSKKLSEKIVFTILYPTNTSMSAVGVVFAYKDSFGEIITSINILISLVVLIIGLFKKHNTRLVLILQAVNLFCIVSFVLDALINKVDLLFGAWLCFAFIIAGLMLQYQTIKNWPPK